MPPKAIKKGLIHAVAGIKKYFILFLFLKTLGLHLEKRRRQQRWRNQKNARTHAAEGYQKRPHTRRSRHQKIFSIFLFLETPEASFRKTL